MVAKSLQALKFEIPKSVKQDFTPYRFAGEIYAAKFGARRVNLPCTEGAK
ncbi:hypothetical protein [uncultured Campylobacter sp.]|nr:hypothetical protein [uncultured Campylobacter sp.]